MSDEKNINLAKQPLSKLQELLERQDAILKNKRLLDRLKDKGLSIQGFYNRIQREIYLRRKVEKLEVDLESLSLTSSDDDFLDLARHVRYVCNKEKPICDTRYRPHRTLVHNGTSPKKLHKQVTEVTAASEPELRHEPTKCIPLPESLTIQSDQADRQTLHFQVKTKSILEALERQAMKGVTEDPNYSADVHEINDVGEASSESENE